MSLAKLESLLQKARADGISTPCYEGFEFVRDAFTKASISNELLDYFKGEERFKLFHDQFYNLGSGWARVTPDTLLRWALWTCEKEGVNVVLERLERYLKLDHSPAQQILAISGVELNEPIELANGISLIPLSLLPPSHIKNIIDPPHLKPENLNRLGVTLPISDHHKPNAALIKRAQLKPRSIEEVDIDKHANAHDMELYEICECLTLLNTCTALPIASWYELEDWVPLYGFLGFSLSTAI